MAKQEVAVDSVEMQAAELKRQRKAAKKAAKDAAAVETIAIGETEVTDEDEAKRLRKAAKKAAREAAVEVKGAVVMPVLAEVDDVDAKRVRKAAKKAAREVAAEVECAVVVPVLEEADGVEAKRLRNAAKKAAREAVANAEGAVQAHDPDVDEVEAKRQRKAAKLAAKETAAAAAGEKEHLEKPKKVGTKRAVEEAEIDQEQADMKRRNKKAIEEARKHPSRRKSASAEDGCEGDMTAFIRGLPWSVSQDMLRRDFTECGEIDRIKMPMNEEGKPRGFAFVKFLTSDGFNAALKFDNTEYGGRTIYVIKADENTQGNGKDGKGKGKGGSGSDGRNNPLTACIKGLPYTVDEIAFKKDFAECGEITKMNMPRNEEGLSRGMAFVTYKLQEGFDAAFKLDGTEYGGRTISISKPLVGGEARSGKDKEGKDKEGKAGKGKGKGKDSKGKSKAGKDGKSKGKDSKGKAGKDHSGKNDSTCSEPKVELSNAMVESTVEKKSAASSVEDDE